MDARNPETCSESEWEQIAPWLDEALLRLREKDRHALVLHYFEKQSLRQVGLALGVSEAAAKKRVARSIEKLRLILKQRKIVVPSVALAGMLSARTVQTAPAGLVAALTASAVAQGSATISALTLVNHTLEIMAWTKIKTAAATAGGLLLVVAAGTTTLVLYSAQSSNETARLRQLWWPRRRPPDGRDCNHQCAVAARQPL